VTPPDPRRGGGTGPQPRRTLDAPPANTPEWVQWRKGGLGASDLPAVLGLDPYRTEHELWQVKTGQVEAFNGNAKTRWGHRLEALGLDVWRDAHPDHVYAPQANIEAYRDEQWPHLWATPDGYVPIGDDSRDVGIEVKVTSAWVEPPDRVKVQALVQMGLAHLERVDIVRLSFDDDPAIFPIERDEQAITDILEAGEAWYVRHVIEGIEPPRLPDEVPADERQQQLAADLRDVRKAIERLERQERAIKDDIIASVAGRGIITGPGFRVEVRAAHDTTRTSWKDVAAQYRTLIDDAYGYDFAAIEAEHQTTSRTGPAVYPKWDEED
jgi:putative phage-type endonuclease